MCLLLYVTILNSPKNSSSPQTQVYILEWKCEQIVTFFIKKVKFD